MTCSTSPPSNPSAGSLRMSTSPSAAPSPALSSARSSLPPTTSPRAHQPTPPSTPPRPRPSARNAPPATNPHRAGRPPAARRYEPCPPTCANWLRYGIQPRNARPGLRPGACKGKAHRREYLGYAGRRVLASRKWSGKTLADHRADRRTRLTSALRLPATDPARYTWEPVRPGDPDHMPNGQRLLHVVADRIQWQTALAEAGRRAAMPPDGSHLAAGRAA